MRRVPTFSGSMLTLVAVGLLLGPLLRRVLRLVPGPAAGCCSRECFEMAAPAACNLEDAAAV